MNDTKEVVYHEGTVAKKSPSGLPGSCFLFPVVLRFVIVVRGVAGMRMWQKRFFVLTNKVLKYFKEREDTEPIGTIPLMHIVKCEYLPDKKIGCRFDLTMKNRRVYALDAESQQQAKEWLVPIGAVVFTPLLTCSYC